MNIIIEITVRKTKQQNTTPNAHAETAKNGDKRPRAENIMLPPPGREVAHPAASAPALPIRSKKSQVLRHHSAHKSHVHAAMCTHVQTARCWQQAQETNKRAHLGGCSPHESRQHRVLRLEIVRLRQVGLVEDEKRPSSSPVKAEGSEGFCAISRSQQ